MIRYLLISQVKRRSALETRAKGEFRGEEEHDVERGEPRGGMFEGRDGPRPDFRGRDGMNMDRSPMDMRRFDCPPDMRGRDMGLHDRGRENNLQNPPGFMGQSRPPMDIGGRDMQGGNMRGPEDGFLNMRERERFQMDMPGLPPMDIRRRLAMAAMGGNGDHGDMRDRDRPRMGRFESDMDLRNRMGSSNDFREQPPQMFRDDGVPMDIRGRPVIPLGRGGPEPMIRGDEMTLRDREFPEPMDSPMGFRERESESLSDEWRKHGMRDRDPLPPMMGRTAPLFPREMQDKLFSNRGKDVDFGEHSQFKDRDRDRQSGFLGKDGTGFNRSERDSKHQNWEKNIPSDFPVRDPTQKPSLLPPDPPLNAQSRDGDKPWPGDRDEKPDRTAPVGSRPPFFQDKNKPNQEHRFASDRVPFKDSSDMALDQGPQKESLMSGPKEPQANRSEGQDQDYRDIDYRTSSGRKYDYNLEDLQGPEKDVNESKLGPTQRLDDSGSQVRFCLLFFFNGKQEKLLFNYKMIPISSMYIHLLCK
uniref:RNA binding motif protein 6 n=1 Tax=Sinocyclocheilus rhinocerous TaxID=307959 RepID=A0A673H986_9TELE